MWLGPLTRNSMDGDLSVTAGVTASNYATLAMQ